VRLAGSHAAGAVARPDVAADLLVRLPKECFHEKDFLNHRYHAKRCLYLCVIEKNLRSSQLIREVSWSTFQDEARKPVLHVYPGFSSTYLSFSHQCALEADTSVSGIFVIMLHLISELPLVQQQKLQTFLGSISE